MPLHCEAKISLPAKTCPIFQRSDSRQDPNSAGKKSKDDQQPSTFPLRLWRGSVQPDWLDYNGHMTEHRYLQVFGESSDALYELIGVDMARADEGAYYTLSTFITHLAECKLGTALEF